MSKRVQISDDAGATWFTFPGNKADKSLTASDINDTIFGADYQSGQTGMITSEMSCNGLFKGFAGYVSKIMKSGTATTFTASGMTLVTGKTYKMTLATQNIWDRKTAVTILDNAVAVSAANILSIDYLHGQVTFISAYTPTGPITATGKYLPMTQIAGANGFTLTQNANAIDNTDYVVAQTNGGYRTYSIGLRTVKLSLKGFYNASNGFEALLQSRPEIVIELNIDGGGLNVARGWFKPITVGQSGNVGELEDASLDFSLSVPDQADISIPFAWAIDPASTLSTALKKALTHYTTSNTIKVNYLPDGTTGFKTSAIITDLSLTGGLDVMNEFSIKFQGSDVPAAYP